MGVSVIFAQALGFLKNNWKVVLIGLGVLFSLLYFKQIMAGVRMNSWVKKYEVEPTKVDYAFLAIQVRDALDGPLWFSDRSALIALINSLASQSEFQVLVREYAVKYNDDLRALLRKKLPDRKYAELRYK